MLWVKIRNSNIPVEKEQRYLENLMKVPAEIYHMRMGEEDKDKYLNDLLKFPPELLSVFSLDFENSQDIEQKGKDRLYFIIFFIGLINYVHHVYPQKYLKSEK